MELQEEQEPPYRLQPGEIAEIARRIPHKWRELAYQTNQFQTHEIENIRCSLAIEDEKSRALTMLTEYNARGGTRNQLAKALKKVGEDILSQEVLREYYLNTCNKL